MPNPHGLNPHGPTLQGIDVASPQGPNFDFARAARDDVSFAWIQISGPAQEHRERNWIECRRAEILRGPYAFLSMIKDGRMQGEQLLQAIAELGGYDDTDLHPMVDIESKIGNPSQQRVLDTTMAFVERVEQELGRPVVIYTYPAYWRETAGAPFPHPLGDRPLYISHFKVNPQTGVVYKLDEPIVPLTWHTWDLWQVTGNHAYRIAGVETDAVVFWGSRNAFVRRFSLVRPDEDGRVADDTGKTVPDAPSPIRKASSRRPAVDAPIIEGGATVDASLGSVPIIRAEPGEKEYKP